MIAAPAILKVTLNAASLSFVTSLTIECLSKTSNLTCNSVFIVVCEPDLRCPVYAIQMNPVAIRQLFHHTVDVWAELALDVSAFFVFVLY